MKLGLLSICIIFLCACSTVKPWEKGYLAKDTMQGDAHVNKAALDRHIYFSKEGASGGGRAAGGGCGCN